MAQKVLVIVHGYDESSGGKPIDDVKWSRTAKAIEIAEMYKDLGDTVIIGFLESLHQAEANTVTFEEWAYQNFDELQQIPTEVLYTAGGDTNGEIQSIHQYVTDNEDIVCVISVSNGDHTPRISKLWSQIDTSVEGYNALVVGTQPQYSNNLEIENKENPLILESASYESLISALEPELWKLDETNLQQLSELITTYLHTQNSNTNE